VPSPGPGEVTIEVRAAGVNPIDYKFYSGALGSSPDNLPVRLGLEVAGVITEVGLDAVGPSGPLSIGDEVVAYPTQGGYATAFTVPAKVVVPKPAELSWEQASGLFARRGDRRARGGSGQGQLWRHRPGPRRLRRGRSACRTTVTRCWSKGGSHRQLLPLAATGKLTLLPAKTYPLTEAAQAHTLLSQGHPNGKLILLPA
jgi:NADPH:quinone reductase-like Zn-dependent oxidoreductase